MKETKKQIMHDVVDVVVSSKVIGNNTVEYVRSNGDKVIRLHHTDIVTVKSNGDIVLDSRGWRTSTTKDRMNCSLISPWRIYQENKIWYVFKGWTPYDAGKYVFTDGITLHADGTVTGAGPSVKTFQAIEKQIRKYVTGYMQALSDGTVPAPSSGDCWYCLMRTVDDSTPLGESVKDTDHLESHFTEKYYVPSLVTRAIELFPVSQAAKWYLGARWNNDGDKTLISWTDGIASRQIGSSLKRYLRRQFGLAS